MTTLPPIPTAAFEAAEQAAYQHHCSGKHLGQCCVRAAVEAAAPFIETATRERTARHLDRAAASLDATGLLGDRVSANTFRQAADYCRDETIWSPR